MPENPDHSHSSHKSESPSAGPHTTSVRGEAWRGFKYGAKAGCIIAFLILALAASITVGPAINAVVVTRGEILNRVNYFQLATDLGGAMFGVLLTSFYGGITGSIVMTLGALIRKRRVSAADAKSP